MAKCSKCKTDLAGKCTIWIAIRDDKGKLKGSVPCCFDCGNSMHDASKDDENNARLLEYEVKRRKAAESAEGL